MSWNFEGWFLLGCSGFRLRKFGYGQFAARKPKNCSGTCTNLQFDFINAINDIVTIIASKAFIFFCCSGEANSTEKIMDPIVFGIPVEWVVSCNFHIYVSIEFV